MGAAIATIYQVCQELAIAIAIIYVTLKFSLLPLPYDPAYKEPLEGAYTSAPLNCTILLLIVQLYYSSTTQ